MRFWVTSCYRLLCVVMHFRLFEIWGFSVRASMGCGTTPSSAARLGALPARPPILLATFGPRVWVIAPKPGQPQVSGPKCLGTNLRRLSAAGPNSGSASLAQRHPESHGRPANKRAAKANVAVGVRRIVVQIGGEHAGVRVIVPVAAAKQRPTEQCLSPVRPFGPNT